MPIVSGKHLRKISDRAALQSADNAEKFITTRKIDSLSKYPELKERMQSLLQNGEKIKPKQWKAEIISYNRKNLERELQNESRQYNKQQN